mmetsp:Transcript_11350/g.29016  ORF Transcript_11350/g.29016 Transcript_11350/m.29016 type:complete len:587 (-) Transcript_11350:41-1801(-)
MSFEQMAPIGRGFLLSNDQLRNSLQVDASEASMQRVWSRLESGKPLRIGVLGSSVAMSGGCQIDYQPQLRCAQFDGVHIHKRFARGYGVVDNVMRSLLHNADRPVRGFVLQVLDWINATWPHSGHRIENAAVDAWTAKAIEPCLLSNERVTSADLLLLEMGSQGWHGSQGAATERIVRKLSRVTSGVGGTAPAMVMVTTRQWCGHSVHGLKRKEKPIVLRTWNGIEDVFARFCKAYGMACLSMRDAIFNHVVASEPNFTVADVAADCLHPEQSRFGYHYMADIIIHFLRHSWKQHDQRRFNQRTMLSTKAAKRSEIGRRAGLQAPILEENQGRQGKMSWRCYELSPTPGLAARNETMWPTQVQSKMHVARVSHPMLRWQSTGGDEGWGPLEDSAGCDALRKCVLRAARSAKHAACLKGRGHWQYCIRTLAPRAVVKPGIVSLLPGAELNFMVDAQAPISGEALWAVSNESSFTMPSTMLALTYLTSYQGMGVAQITCESGCVCEPHHLDALQAIQPARSGGLMGKHQVDGAPTRNVSVATVAEIPIRFASRACSVRVRNVPRVGGGTSAVSKWKLLQVRVGWELFA